MLHTLPSPVPPMAPLDIQILESMDLPFGLPLPIAASTPTMMRTPTLMKLLADDPAWDYLAGVEPVTPPISRITPGKSPHVLLPSSGDPLLSSGSPLDLQWSPSCHPSPTLNDSILSSSDTDCVFFYIDTPLDGEWSDITPLLDGDAFGSFDSRASRS